MLQSKKTRVLVVDDDPICLRAAEELLKERYHCSVTKMNCATAAFNLIKRLSTNWDFLGFDLILMDIYLPDLDGNALATLIRATQPKLKNIPIIAVTSESSVGKMKMFLTEGIDDIIIKPLTVSKLNSVVDKYFVLPRRKQNKGTID